MRKRFQSFLSTPHENDKIQVKSRSYSTNSAFFDPPDFCEPVRKGRWSPKKSVGRKELSTCFDSSDSNGFAPKGRRSPKKLVRRQDSFHSAIKEKYKTSENSVLDPHFEEDELTDQNDSVFIEDFPISRLAAILPPEIIPLKSCKTPPYSTLPSLVKRNKSNKGTNPKSPNKENINVI